VTEQREVRIEPGDHFWALAERDLAEALGRPATDSEVVPHWQAILEANADRLQVPGNPDLLLPGQLVVLPPVAGVSP
jgi:nucleoid-associated protein YgaU